MPKLWYNPQDFDVEDQPLLRREAFDPTMNFKPMFPSRLLTGLLVAVFLIVALAGFAGAQQPPTPEEITAVARELYCPLCNGVRLDTCELQACEQMRQVISDKLAAGVTKEQIKKEFVAQYGPIVLGEPPRQGLNLLGGWLLPIGLVVAAGVAVTVMALRWSRRPQPAAVTAVAAPQSPQSGGDDYLARVEADLAEMES